MRSKQAPAAAPARNPPSPRPQPRAAPALTPTAEGPGNLQLAQSAAMGLVSPLRPGPPNAPEEHAARRFARDIMTAPTRGPCACGGTCPACRGRSGAAGARALGRNPAPLKGGSWPFGPMAGRPLDMASRRWFEDRLQGPLGPVLVHDDPQTADHARAMGARAFAVGNRIGFARDQYRPSTPSGRAILAHEIAHVALGHQGLRRDGFDDGLSDAEIDAQIEQGRALAKEKEQERAKHQAWTEGVVKRWPTDLGEQSKDLASERERLSLGLSAAQAKAFDAANEGAGWLADALKKQGYDGPSIVDVKQMWAQALVAADAIKLSANAPAKEEGKPTLSADTKLAALSAVSTYFNGAKKFSEAAEAAHLKYTTEENARLTAQYDKEYADYLEGLDTAGNLMVGVPVSGPRMPKKPTLIVAPPPVSGTFSGHITRLEKAGSPAEWEAVAENVRTSASAVAKLVVASLPAKSAVVAQVSGIEALDARLKKYADSHTLFRRIPAVFYPKDATSTHTDAAGNQVVIPDAIPWQFYLGHRTKFVSNQRMCAEVGEWVLTDLTNTAVAENVIASSAADTEKLTKGEWVDPPIALFTPLNSKLRFPEGELYFTLPSGTHYVHHMTEPWSLSDWLSAIGMAFAAIALVAAVVATGGAAAPAAIAFGAGIASAGFGIAGTLAELKEKEEHGLLTQKDKDRAMIDIGLNVLAVASMGLGRVVTAPGAALRFGAKFGMMANALKVLRVANFVGDLAQVGIVTSDLVAGFQAIKDNPNLTEEQRDKMIGQLARRALLTGALMTVAIKGDISDLKANGKLNISHIDADGTPVAAKSGDLDATAPTPRATGVDPGAPHAKVTGEAHAKAEAGGTGLELAGNRHAVGVAGAGPTRDIYFCSDFCTSITNRLTAVLEALPQKHPMRPALEDMLAKAKNTRAQLQAGKIDDAAAEQVGKDLRDRLGRLVGDEPHGKTLAQLLDMNPDALSASAEAVSAGIAKNMDIATVRAEAEARFAPVGDQPSLADVASAKLPKPPRTWLVAPEGVIDAESRRFLPDFDQRIAGTGGIEKIRAGMTPQGTLGVNIEGTILPGRLTRNPKRVGENVALAPSFNQRARSFLGGLAKQGLAGWQRLHLWGPGFGDEAAAGMMLGPSSVNQFWQNGTIVMSGGKKSYAGIEGFLRELSSQAEAAGGKLKLSATAEAFGNPTPGGFKIANGEPVLHRVEYKFQIVDANGKPTSTTTVTLEVPDPAGWKSPLTVKPIVTVGGDGA